MLGSINDNLSQQQGAMKHRQHGDQQIQIGRRPGTIAFDPAKGPRQREHNTDHPVDRNKPGVLNNRGKGSVQRLAAETVRVDVSGESRKKPRPTNADQGQIMRKSETGSRSATLVQGTLEAIAAIATRTSPTEGLQPLLQLLTVMLLLLKKRLEKGTIVGITKQGAEPHGFGVVIDQALFEHFIVLQQTDQISCMGDRLQLGGTGSSAMKKHLLNDPFGVLHLLDRLRSETLSRLLISPQLKQGGLGHVLLDG